MSRLADLLLGHRRGVGVFLAALTALALAGLVRLEFEDRPRAIFRAGDEDYARLEQVFRDFGSDDGDAVVVLEADDWFTPESVALLRDLRERLVPLPGVISVISFDTLPVLDAGFLPRPLVPGGTPDRAALERARADARVHPLVGGRLLSEEGRTTLLIVRHDPALQRIEHLKPVVESIERGVRGAVSGTSIRARLTGIPPIRVEIFGLLRNEAMRSDLLAGLAGLCVAALLFRRVGPVLLTASGAFLGSLWTMGLYGWAGWKFDLLSSAVPMLVLVIGFTDALHLVIDFRRSRAAGQASLEAARGALRHLGQACALTSLTTAIGFGSLAVSRVDAIRNFGIQAAIGVLLTFVAVVTVVPWLASFTRRAPASRPEELSAGRLTRAVERVAFGRPRSVAWSGVALVIGLIAVATQLSVENRLSETSPEDSETIQALFHVDEVFGGIVPAYVLVEWEAELALESPEVMGALRDVEALIEADPLAAAPLSAARLLALFGPHAPPSRLGLLPDALLHSVARPDLGRAVVSFRLPDEGAELLDPAVARLRAGLERLAREHDGVRLHLTGTGIVARENVNAMIRDLALGLALASVLIFFLMTLELGSLRLGAISVLPNILPLGVTAAALVVFGLPLQMTSAVVFTVCLGLAVDDTVHVLNRFKIESRKSGDVRAAVATTLGTVAPALVVTTAVLMAGFGVLTLSSIPSLRLFGSLGVLGFVAALIGDLFLLPALLVAFARPVSESRGDRRGPSG